eukprot:15362734-Ditylum_brightwellii.AAC.1
MADGQPNLKEEQDLPPNDILIKTTTRHTTKLDHILVHKGSRMLGVCQAGSLQMETAFEHKKVYIPAVTYSKAATSFKKKQHKKLMSTLPQISM